MDSGKGKKEIPRKKGEMGQSSVSPVVYNSKKKIIKGLGFALFLIGAFFILNSVFSITGHISQTTQIVKDKISILGLILEVIGVTLMVMKFRD